MMYKKLSIILMIIALIILGFSLTAMQAQKYKEEPGFTYEDLTRLEEKIDEILNLPKERSDKEEKSNKEILKKLDLILSNQTKIISELEIVKVRASRR